MTSSPFGLGPVSPNARRDADAVVWSEAFRNGNLPPIVADQPKPGSINLPDKARNDKQDEKDGIAQQAAPAKPAPAPQTEGNNDMGAGSDAVEMFRKGKLNGAEAVPIEAGEPEALPAEEISDTAEIVQQATAKIIPMPPRTKEKVVEIEFDG